jgi:glucosylceramidase
MFPRTRRDFVKFSALTAAGSAIPGASLVWAAEQRPARAWVTSQHKKFQPIESLKWQPSGSVSTDVIRVDPGEQRQEILGFGAALTDASCFLLHNMESSQQQALLEELYGPKGLRFSVGRTCIGSSDYSENVYSFDESPEPDPELKRFDLGHDRAYILPTLRAAREQNPDLFLFSSPWSPPGWMKANGSMLGGSMRKHYFGPYAEYFLHFLQGYEKDGVKINAVTIQNETDTDQDGRMPAALWGQEYEMEFVKSYLGPALQKASIGTKIWILDHNYNLWGRAIDELSDPDVNKYVDGVAWHGYAGSPEAMTRVKEAFPAKHCYWTEGGPDISDPNYANDWAKWSSTFSGILRNWARCIVSWNVLLDENGKPNIGPFSCGGVVTINSKTRELTRSGQYWALAHYSKLMQRGAHVTASHGDVRQIDHAAFENPDGTYGLVITNQGDQQHIACQFRDQVLDLTLEPDSITSLLW